MLYHKSVGTYLPFYNTIWTRSVRNDTTPEQFETSYGRKKSGQSDLKKSSKRIDLNFQPLILRFSLFRQK